MLEREVISTKIEGNHDGRRNEHIDVFGEQKQTYTRSKEKKKESKIIMKIR